MVFKLDTNGSSFNVDWSWKLREAVDRIKNSYEHIGRSTGAPFLAIVYPPECETAVIKEWHALSGMFGTEFNLIQIDILDITMKVLQELGVENIVETIQNPMPGSNPETELASMWLSAIVNEVKNNLAAHNSKKTVIVLEQLAALYPAAGPRSLMQALWDTKDLALDNPVIIFIPGRLIEPRVFEFLGKTRELMYRGDIL
jgi:hypothetical protein